MFKTIFLSVYEGAGTKGSRKEKRIQNSGSNYRGNHASKMDGKKSKYLFFTFKSGRKYSTTRLFEL